MDTGAAGYVGPLILDSCIIKNNGGYGIAMQGTDTGMLVCDYTCFHNNTSGNIDNESVGFTLADFGTNFIDIDFSGVKRDLITALVVRIERLG